MKPIINCLSLCLLLTWVSCRSSNGVRNPNATPTNFVPSGTFASYAHIVSTHWADSQGRVLEFVCASNVVFNMPSDVLIAEYGDTNSGIVTCLDFYRPINLNSARSGFILLAHDIEPATMMVTSIKTKELDDKAAILITRETIPNGASQRQAAQYTWRYFKDLRMSLDLETREWSIP